MCKLKYLIIGAGGTGGAIGSHMAQAGHDVTFIARGRHLAAMKENGLRVNRPDGEFVIDPVSAYTTDDDHNFTLSETISAPYIIEPHSLFGGKTVYTATYKAKSEAKLLCIDKQYIYTQLNNYEIFRLNYLNILSNKYQQARVKLWQTRFGQLEEKLATFLLNRCLQPYGEKTLQITMDDLGKLIGETRINVSKVLNEMQKKELVQLKRKEIYIPEFGKLTDGLLEQI